MAMITRWWWLRHAPVPKGDDPNKIIGQLDSGCDLSDTARVDALRERLPTDPVWIASHLPRARMTAAALGGSTPKIEPDLAEQHLGDWQGSTWDEVHSTLREAANAFWKDPGRSRPPGGESFADVIARVDAAAKRLTEAHAGQDIVAVVHAGTIRAAVASALGLDPNQALALAVDNLSLTRIDHVISGGPYDLGGAWRVKGVNQVF
jgi:alpha-ribazole phosphatase